MKVCVLGGKSYPPKGDYYGGIEKHIYEVVERLKKRIEFYVLTRKKFCSDENVIEVPYLDLRLTRTPTHNFLSIPIAKKIIRENEIDFVHAHESFAGLAANILRKISGEPYLLTMHTIDSLQPEWKPFEIPFAAVERKAIKRAKLITCPGEGIKDKLVKLRKADPKKVRVIPNGVDVDKFNIPDWWAKLKVHAPNKLLVCVGRLSESKGLPWLIEAMRELKDWNLWIAGGGPLEKKLKRKASTMKNVKLLGFRSDIPEILCAADIYVQPSLSEGQPISLIEAMAAGKPIVATTVGEIPNVLGKAGVYINPKDSKAIVKAVRGLERDKKKAKRLGWEARKLAKGYSWDKVAKGFAKVYKEMMD